MQTRWLSALGWHLSRAPPCVARVWRWAHPSPPLRLREALDVERLVASEHEVDGASELVCEDRERFGLGVLAFEAAEQRLALRALGHEQHGGFREGPLQVGVADLGAAGPEALSGRALLALHQSGVGGEVLDRGEAANIMDLVEEGEAEDLAGAGQGRQQAERSEER